MDKMNFGGMPPMGGPGGPGGMPPMGGPGGPGGMPPMGGPGGPGGMPGMPGMGGPGGPGGMPGMPGMGGPGGPGGFPEGGPPPMETLADTAAIKVVDGKRTSEYDDGTVAIEVAPGAAGVSEKGADGVKLTSGAYGAEGVAISGKGQFTLGGKNSYYEVDGKKYNSVLDFTVDSPVKKGDHGGTGIAAGDEAVLIVDNSYLKVDGAGRYVTAAYNDSKLVINDSYVEGTGPCANTDAVGEGMPNDKLLMYGHARTNFSVNQSATYYYNSSCIAEGWAALSTDAAREKGLDLYAYQSYAEAVKGGYGTYADFSCRVKLYGSVLQGNEMGAIISKSGEIYLYDNLAATKDDCLAYADACGCKVGSEKVRSQLIGGRNAIMIHAPDMMNEGIGATDTARFEVYGGLLKTDPSLKSAKNYHEAYGPAVGAYVDYINGSAILVKSTSCYIVLDGAEIEAFNGNLIHTVINSDSMNNLLKPGDADDARVDNINVAVKNMELKGNILHEDYQRKLNLSLENAALTGAVISGTVESWNARWTAFKDDPKFCWAKDDSWSTPYGVYMTMGKGSRWTAKGKSTLNTLTVEEGAVLEGKLYVAGKETAFAPGVYKDVVVEG